ncbi:MAG: DUF5615 family PIN-like protein [Planctomycetota bacterium]
MRVWVDAQLTPRLAAWLASQFNVEAQSLRDLGLQRTKDSKIFFEARALGAVVITKDADFVRLLEAHGPPPQILWLTIGNTTNERLQDVLQTHWDRIVKAFASGEALVEISAEHESA